MVSGGVWMVSGWCLSMSGICLDVIYVIRIENSWIGVIIYSYCLFSQCPQIGYTGGKVEIENRRWRYSFSQLDPMLFRVFGPKLTQKSPPGRPPVNSNFGGLPPPPTFILKAREACLRIYAWRSLFCSEGIHPTMQWRRGMRKNQLGLGERKFDQKM